MLGIDFDFGHYVAEKRGEVAQRARDGAAYSYAGERKVRRALAGARPVTLAVLATTRLWKSRAKDDLLTTARKATDREFPEVLAAAVTACKVLTLRPTAVYIVTGTTGLGVRALGTGDDAFVFIDGSLVDALEGDELTAAIGHALGHIQNNHVLYATALYYLNQNAASFVRWTVQPAILALQAWARRADITCDRAALVASRDLDATLRAIAKIVSSERGLPLDDADAAIAELRSKEGSMRSVSEIFSSHPTLRKRVRALELFAESQFYLRLIGGNADSAQPADDIDVVVSEMFSVF